MIDTDKLRRAARREGIETFYQLAKRFAERGYRYSDSQAQRLWDGKNDPRLSTVLTLCEVLGCEITDITVKKAHKGRSVKKNGRGALNKRGVKA